MLVDGVAKIGLRAGILTFASHKDVDAGIRGLRRAWLADPQFGDRRNCGEFEAPVQELGPHVASLGMRFYTGKMFPEEYRHQIFIAEHGSWNRSEKIGYRISLVRLEGNEAVSYEVFAEGWLEGQSAWGRPVDVLVMPDGSLLVSDDQARMIYRITYGN